METIALLFTKKIAVLCKQKQSCSTKRCPDNCPRRKFSTGWLPPGQLPPDNCLQENCHRGKLRTSPDNCPLDDCSREIIPKIIAPWKYPPGKCPRVPFGWFVTYIISLRKTSSSRNIFPGTNYTRFTFPQKSEIVVL